MSFIKLLRVLLSIELISSFLQIKKNGKLFSFEKTFVINLLWLLGLKYYNK